MANTLSPKELGEAIGVSQSTLKRWVDAGRIEAVRTEGGHRRITLAEAVRFIRERGIKVQAPQLLGLPEAPLGIPSGADGYEVFFDALRHGRFADVQSVILSSYVQGMSAADICDDLVARALHTLGELWIDQEDGIAIEHRATTICVRALHQLRTLIPRAPDGAPVAVGAGPANDIYVIPSLMCGIVLAAAGWQDIDFGADMPLADLAQTAIDADADLVWLAMTVTQPSTTFHREMQELLATLESRGTAFVLGGQAHQQTRLPSIPTVHTGHRMADLDAFARGLGHALAHRS